MCPYSMCSSLFTPVQPSVRWDRHWELSFWIKTMQSEPFVPSYSTGFQEKEIRRHKRVNAVRQNTCDTVKGKTLINVVQQVKREQVRMTHKRDVKGESRKSHGKEPLKRSHQTSSKKASHKSHQKSHQKEPRMTHNRQPEGNVEQSL